MFLKPALTISFENSNLTYSNNKINYLFFISGK